MFEQERTLAADLLAQRIAALLRDEHSRSPLIPGSKHKRNFPGAWVLMLELDAKAPLAANDGGQALEADQLRCIRVHMIPVADE